jgi:hypothetical protein
MGQRVPNLGSPKPRFSKKKLNYPTSQGGILLMNQNQGTVNRAHFDLLSTGDTDAICGMIRTLRFYILWKIYRINSIISAEVDGFL